MKIPGKAMKMKVEKGRGRKRKDLNPLAHKEGFKDEKEMLATLISTDCWQLAEIAVFVGLSNAQFYKRCREHGIPKRGRGKGGKRPKTPIKRVDVTFLVRVHTNDKPIPGLGKGIIAKQSASFQAQFDPMDPRLPKILRIIGEDCLERSLDAILSIRRGRKA